MQITSSLVFESCWKNVKGDHDLIRAILQHGTLQELGDLLLTEPKGQYGVHVLHSAAISCAFRTEDSHLLDRICNELEAGIVALSHLEDRAWDVQKCLFMTIKFLHDPQAWSYASKLSDKLIELRPRVLGAYDWAPKLVHELDEIDSDFLCEAWAQCHVESFELIRSVLALGSLSTLSAYLETRPCGSHSTNLLISTTLNLAFRTKDAKLMDHICDEIEAVLFTMSDSEVRLLCWRTCLEKTTQFLQDESSWTYAYRLKDTLAELRPRVLDTRAEGSQGSS